MSSSNLQPKWWQLYLMLPLLIGLFILDFRLKLSIRGHQAFQIVILLLVYGLVHLWLKANSTALSKMDQRQYHGRITVIRMHTSQLPPISRTMLQLPDNEIKGMLSDTFEMDYIDAEAFPIDEVSQELNKE